MEGLSLLDIVKNESRLVSRMNVSEEMEDKMNKMITNTKLDYFFESDDEEED